MSSAWSASIQPVKVDTGAQFTATNNSDKSAPNEMSDGVRLMLPMSPMSPIFDATTSQTRAYCRTIAGQDVQQSLLQAATIPMEPLGPGDVQLHILYSTLDSDTGVLFDDGPSTNATPGRAFVGRVVATGKRVVHLTIGQVVVVGQQHRACFHLPAPDQCQAVRAGQEQFCSHALMACDDPMLPHSPVRNSSGPTVATTRAVCAGGMRQVARVCASLAFPLPQHQDEMRSLDLIPPLLTVGVRVWTALTRGGVAVSGTVCGVVGDSDAALTVVARHFLQRLGARSIETMQGGGGGGWDVAVVTADRVDLDQVAANVKPGGRVILLSTTAGCTTPSLAALLARQITLTGNHPVASVREIKAMLAWALDATKGGRWLEVAPTFCRTVPHAQATTKLTLNTHLVTVCDMNAGAEI